MDDYPNSSEALEPYEVEMPEERKEAEEKEQSRVTSSVAVIKEIIEWFEAREKYFSSPQAIAIDEMTPDYLAKQIALTCKHFSAVYQQEAGQFRADFAKFLEPADEA